MGTSKNNANHNILDNHNHDGSGEELVTTPTLERYHLSFNAKYNLIICNICHWGIPLSYVYQHIVADTWNTYEYNPAGERGLGCWTRTLKVQHAHSVDGKRLKKPCVRDKQALHEIIGQELHNIHDVDTSRIRTISTSKDMSHPKDWLMDGWPAHDQVGPIKGLQVFDLNWWACYDCPNNRRAVFACTKSLMNHRAKEHPGEWRCREIRDSCVPRGTQVQSMTLVQGLALFFIVPTATTTTTSSSSTNAPGHQPVPTPAALMRKRKQLILGPVAQRCAERRLVIPFLLTSGADSFLGKFNREAILNLREVRSFARPHLIEKPLKRLFPIIRDTFWSDSDNAVTANDAILLAISDCNLCVIVSQLNQKFAHANTMSPCNDRNPHFRPRKFTALTRLDSRAKYAATEIQFLWMNLKHWCKPLNGNDSTPLFCHDRNQSASLERLWTCLNATRFHCKDAEEALFDTFYALYFPRDNLLQATEKFRSPVWVFMAICCLSNDSKGGYQDPALIPPVISQVQYSMRLRAFHKIRSSLLKEIEKKDPESVEACSAAKFISLAARKDPPDELDITTVDLWFR
jgi:hypothetical protein